QPWLDAIGRVAELPVRAGHNDRPDTFVCVPGQDAAGARRLVMRARVYRHQGESLCHAPSLPEAAAWYEQLCAGTGARLADLQPAATRTVDGMSGSYAETV